MNLPIRVPPLVERWDCTGCGKCCRGTYVPLDDDDLRRLREQRWEQHPEFRRVRTIERQGLLSGRYRLARRDDGTCVFLTAAGRCRIHEEFGGDGKPLICQMYPLQLVPLDTVAYLTLRRSCPAAAADEGRELAAHRDAAKRYAQLRPRLVQSAAPPAVQRGWRRSWTESLVVAEAIAQLLTDQRYPLVRRLVHGLRFCDSLEKSRLAGQDAGQLRERVTGLVEAAPQGVGELFRARARPGRAAAILFRQTVAEYLRLHPLYVVRESWRERPRLVIAALAFARGKGQVPRLHDAFPPADFAALDERALGPLERDVQQPLNAYFEAHAASRQYAVVSRPDWPLLDKFRALALAYPVALWMLRYFSGPTPPTRAAAIDIVTAIERGQGCGPLVGRQQRRRIAHLTDLQALEQLAVWYAR